MSRKQPPTRENVTRPVLNDFNIERLKRPRKGYAFHWDSQIGGLGIRISAATGKRAWIVDYEVGDNRRRVVIGEFPTMRELAARERASIIKAAARDGRELPEYAPRIRRTGGETLKPATVAWLCEDWLNEKRARNKASIAPWERTITGLILPHLGANSSIQSVGFRDIERMFLAISTQGQTGKPAPVRANRVLAITSSIFSRGRLLGLCERNPCEQVRPNHEEPRKAEIKRAELIALREAIDAHPDQRIADAILLAMFTGARKTETLGARFDEFRPLDNPDPDEDDPELLWWHLPAARAKTRKARLIPANDEVIGVLERRLAARKDDCPFLFPGNVGPCLVDITSAWKALTKRAGIEGFRLHDLRHLFVAESRKARTDPVTSKLAGYASERMTLNYGTGMPDLVGMKLRSDKIAARLLRKVKPAMVAPTHIDLAELDALRDEIAKLKSENARLKKVAAV